MMTWKGARNLVKTGLKRIIVDLSTPPLPLKLCIGIYKVKLNITAFNPRDRDRAKLSLISIRGRLIGGIGLRKHLTYRPGNTCPHFVEAVTPMDNNIKGAAEREGQQVACLMMSCHIPDRRLSRLGIQEAPQLAATAWVLEFAQRFRFDLTNPLPGYRELLTDFFKRVISVHTDTKTHPQHTFLTRRQ